MQATPQPALPQAQPDPVDFPGASAFISALDEILASNEGNPEGLTDAMRRLLCRSIRDRQVRLPDCLRETIPGRYARRLLHHSPRWGYSVVAMTWGPGQGTPIHDHSGMWCVEGVWDGALEITQYELVGREDDRWRFEPRGAVEAVAGSAGSLIPPHEYHTIRNPSQEHVAVSVHIYSGTMSSCCVYQPMEDGWHRPVERALSLD